jgi:hypothetical protein
VNGTASFSVAGAGRMVGIVVTADGALLPGTGLANLLGFVSDMKSTSLSTLATGLSPSTSHTVTLRGCASGTGVSIPANTGTLSVMAAK